MAQSYKYAEATILVTLRYLAIPLATLFGFIIFGEVPGIWVWIGAIMIIIALSYLAKGEARK